MPLRTMNDWGTLVVIAHAARTELSMNDEIDRQDRERRLVKMTSDEFASGVNKAFRRANQEWYNRDALLMALVVLGVIGLSVYHYFFGAQ
jgi:hypothetical protein